MWLPANELQVCLVQSDVLDPNVAWRSSFILTRLVCYFVIVWLSSPVVSFAEVIRHDCCSCVAYELTCCPNKHTSVPTCCRGLVAVCVVGLCHHKLLRDIWLLSHAEWWQTTTMTQRVESFPSEELLKRCVSGWIVSRVSDGTTQPPSIKSFDQHHRCFDQQIFGCWWVLRGSTTSPPHNTPRPWAPLSEYLFTGFIPL